MGDQFWVPQDETHYDKTAKHIGKNGGIFWMAFPLIHLSNNESQIQTLDQKNI